MSFFDDEEVQDAFKEFEQETKAKFTKRDEEKKLLDGAELNRIKKEAFEFLKEQLKIPNVEDRECFYTDEYGYQTTFFAVDPTDLTRNDGSVWNKPELKNKDDPNEATLSVLYPLIKNRINLKLDKKFYTIKPYSIERGARIVARGSGWYQYSPLEQVEGKTLYLFEKDFIATMKKLDGADYKKLEDIPKANYTRYPGFRMYQILDKTVSK